MSVSRKLTNFLASGLLGATLAVTPSCHATISNKPEIVEPERNILADTLEDLVKGTHAVRTIATYVSEDGNTVEQGWHGSAFVIDSFKGNSYLLTAKHVTEVEPYLARQYLDAEPDGTISLKAEIYQLAKAEYFLVDDVEDTKTEDDIPVEVLREFRDGDMSLIKADAELYTPEFEFGDPEKLRLNDTMYVVGYPAGHLPIVAEGKVVNTGNDKEFDYTGKYTMTFNPTIPGMSGGSWFTIKNGKAYLQGQCVAYVYGRRGYSHLMLGTDIDAFLPEVKSILENERNPLGGKINSIVEGIEDFLQNF